MRTAILLSGGMDSAALAFWLRPQVAITIDYGHRPAKGEIRAAKAICAELGIQHHIIRVDVSSLGSGDLVGSLALEHAPAREWWPYRNQFLATLAAMKCQQTEATRLLIGSLKSDSFHADGTPAFVERLNTLFELQEGNLELVAPAIELSAEELLISSGAPLSFMAWSHSCHAEEYACGYCRGCHKHYTTMSQVFGQPY